MRHFPIVKRTLSLTFLFLAQALAQRLYGDDMLAQTWQKRIDRQSSFEFREEEANVLASLRRYGGNCQIHMVFDRTKVEPWKFSFVREGRTVLSLDGHEYSVFRTDADDPFLEEKPVRENTLYFAHFCPGSCGCVLAAYDLATGKRLWSTELKAVGSFDHSLHVNRINMRVFRGDDVVWIAGSESSGNYVEIVDARTGRILAHRVFK
jgi:hypothetical protein